METLKPYFTLIALAILFSFTCHAQEHHGALTANGSLYFRSEPVNNYVKANDKDAEIYYYIHYQIYRH